MAEKELFQLGTYTFEVLKNSIDSYTRGAKYRWFEGKNITEKSSLSFGGLDAETITFTGSIVTVLGGLKNIDRLRELAREGEPQILLTGYGEKLGKWVIENISEKASALMAMGLPRKIAFTIKLKKYD
jgi:phage protein U